MTIRTATAADAAVIADLARRTFFDTFASSNDATDMALHLQSAYGVDQQTREITDRDITTLVVEIEGHAVAYAQVRADHVPDCVKDAGAVELWRFYVDKQWHGRGIAQALMARVRTVAQERGAKTLWLGVWERNDRARAFYTKSGFTDVGEHIFLFGTDPQTDRVMVTSI
ncbi:MAG: GNAT family N-acetyltransferase [Cyanobacteria bacterium]|nr:GNAT family N-acetyltransferase [Cyanobacteriota bacterium]